MSNEWIKVTDKLPEKNQRYLVIKTYLLHNVTMWIEIDSFHDGRFGDKVTHWQFLPEIPQDEK